MSDAEQQEQEPENTPSKPLVVSTDPIPPPQAEEKNAGWAEMPESKQAVDVESPESTSGTPVAQSEAESPQETADEFAARETRERELADSEVLASSRSHTRRAFIGLGVAAAAGYSLYHYVEHSPGMEMQPGPLRDAFQFNADLARKAFRDASLAPTYPIARSENLRVNGVYGLKMMLPEENWRLQVVGSCNVRDHPRYTNDVTAWEYRYTHEHAMEDQGHDTKVDPKLETAAKMAPEPMLDKAAEDERHTGRRPRGLEESGESTSTLTPNTPGLLLTMDDIRSLPRHELVTQFKCIEGWSQIVHWAGVRMADFIDAYPPQLIDGKEPKFVYMETPDGDYYNGYDLDSLRHPQALLVTEMMGAPLTQFHGAPLRLHMPTKYGYKQIKRIGLIAYTNARPDDYWTKLGYDWYGGL